MANARGFVLSENSEQIAASGLGALNALLLSLRHSPEFCEQYTEIVNNALARRDVHALLTAIETIIVYATANKSITFEELRHNQFAALSIVLSQDNQRTVIFSADTAANTKISTIILAALDKKNMYMLKEINPQHFQTHKSSNTYQSLDVDDAFLKAIFDRPLEPITPAPTVSTTETTTNIDVEEVTISISPTESPEIKPIPKPRLTSSAPTLVLSNSASHGFFTTAASLTPPPSKSLTPPPSTKSVTPPVKSIFEGVCSIQ